MKSVRANWSRIERWLAANAPKVLASLRPGASDAAITAAEKSLGRSLPEDWRELYAVHDGLDPTSQHSALFHGVAFFPLERVVSEYIDSRAGGDPDEKEPTKAVDSGIRSDDMFEPGWIPLGNDWGEVLLQVDVNPAADGRSGQVIFTDAAYRVAGLIAASVGGLLESFADDLEDGKYHLAADAMEDGVEFLSCDRENDIANWWKSPRWKHLET